MAKKKAALKKAVDPQALHKAAFEAGRLARQNREEFKANPYGPDDECAKHWEDGWIEEINTESDPRILINELNDCGITTSIADLELLSKTQRYKLLDWKDLFEDDYDPVVMLGMRPGFVKPTGKMTEASADGPAMHIIEFVQPGPESVDEAPVAAANVSAIPPLEVIPPANEQEVDLRQLMTDFDNAGVAIDETQWRTLKPDEQNTCRTWVKYRLQGTLSPVPYCLIPWASEKLKGEYATYAEDQEKARQVRLPVTFDKPSVVAPGEDDEGKIKVVAKAAAEDLPGSLADRLFRYKRCKIHFSTRKADQWEQMELVDANPIYVTISDVSGYKASRHETSFSFLVDQEVLCVNAAFKELWGFAGSIVVEVLGVADGKKRHAEESGESAPEAASKPAHKPDPKQKTLPGAGDDEDAGDDETPDTEYLFAESGDLKVAGTVHKDSDGWYVDIDADTPDNWECENDDIDGTMSPRTSPVLAIEARLGQIVDHWQQWKDNSDADQIIRQLRFWLVELNAGKTPAEIQAAAEAERNASAVGDE